MKSGSLSTVEPGRQWNGNAAVRVFAERQRPRFGSCQSGIQGDVGREMREGHPGCDVVGVSVRNLEQRAIE
jgi:hypothetical protein